jgi:hypothetical protein
MQVTALQILQTVAAETGLPIPQTLESTLDPGTLQLIALLNSAGYESLFYYPWEQLTRKQTLTTTDAVTSYPLPDDWAYYIDQTQQNVSARWPMAGPISTQAWSYIETSLVGAINTVFQIRANKLQILPAPTGATNLQMYYISNGWVEDGLNLGSYKPNITHNSDIPILDWLMLVKFVKLKLWESKGFDSTAFRQDFINIWDALVGKDVGSPKLNIMGPWMNNQYGYVNVPQASWPQ